MHVVRRMGSCGSCSTDIRGGFPGDFWNRFGMEIITADLNDYLRIYLLPSVLAFLLVYRHHLRGFQENDVRIFIIMHASFFTELVCCSSVILHPLNIRCNIDNSRKRLSVLLHFMVRYHKNICF